MRLAAYEEAVRRHWRTNRMRAFAKIMRPKRGSRILDVGGLPQLWDLAALDVEVTLLNLPGTLGRVPERAFSVIEGDICAMPDIGRHYDIVFSNSVLEHVGSLQRQQQFARAVSSAPAYWIQVPAPEFPIEQHCRVPFWWSRSLKWRARRIAGWRAAGNRWTSNQMATTRPIDRDKLRMLFPNACIATEWFLAFPKSHYAYRNGRAAE